MHEELLLAAASGHVDLNTARMGVELYGQAIAGHAASIVHATHGVAGSIRDSVSTLAAHTGHLFQRGGKTSDTPHAAELTSYIQHGHQAVSGASPSADPSATATPQAIGGGLAEHVENIVLKPLDRGASGHVAGSRMLGKMALYGEQVEDKVEKGGEKEAVAAVATVTEAGETAEVVKRKTLAADTFFQALDLMTQGGQLGTSLASTDPGMLFEAPEEGKEGKHLARKAAAVGLSVAGEFAPGILGSGLEAARLVGIDGSEIIEQIQNKELSRAASLVQHGVGTAALNAADAVKKGVIGAGQREGVIGAVTRHSVISAAAAMGSFTGPATAGTSSDIADKTQYVDPQWQAARAAADDFINTGASPSSIYNQSMATGLTGNIRTFNVSPGPSPATAAGNPQAPMQQAQMQAAVSDIAAVADPAAAYKAAMLGGMAMGGMGGDPFGPVSFDSFPSMGTSQQTQTGKGDPGAILGITSQAELTERAKAAVPSFGAAQEASAGSIIPTSTVMGAVHGGHGGHGGI